MAKTTGLVPEHKTIRLKGLTDDIGKHMRICKSENLSEWIRGAIEFRLKYDTLGTGEISQSEEKGYQRESDGMSNMHNVSLLSSISSRLDDFQNTALTDNEMMIRLMLQIREIMTGAIGKVIFDNPNMNTQGLNLMEIAKAEVTKSKAFVEKHRGR